MKHLEFFLTQRNAENMICLVIFLILIEVLPPATFPPSVPKPPKSKAENVRQKTDGVKERETVKLLWKPAKCDPADWSRFTSYSDNDFKYTQLRNGSVIIANGERRGGLGLWSAEGDFIKPLASLPIRISSIHALADGRFRMEYDGKTYIFSTEDIITEATLSSSFDASDIKDTLLSPEGGYIQVKSSLEKRSHCINILNRDGSLQYSCGPGNGCDVSVFPLFTGGFALLDENSKTITVWQPEILAGEKSWKMISTLTSTPNGNGWAIAALPNGRLVIGNQEGKRHFWNPITNELSRDFGAAVPKPCKDEYDRPFVSGFKVLQDERILETNKYGAPRYMWDARGTLQARFQEEHTNDVAAIHVVSDVLVLTNSRGERWFFWKP